jgi:hypothetical protein
LEALTIHENEVKEEINNYKVELNSILQRNQEVLLNIKNGFLKKSAALATLTQEKYNAPSVGLAGGIGFFGITWCIYKAGVFNKITLFKVFGKALKKLWLVIP